MIEAKAICRSFRQWDGSTLSALSDVSFRIEDGQLVVLAGENGSGKSLLMKIIAGLEKPSSGTVETSDPVALVFQDADAQILADTVIEDVRFSLKNRKLKKERSRRASLRQLRPSWWAIRATTRVY